MDATDSFGYWVRRRRKALDMTQEDLAQRVGCAAVTLRKIEADERRPSLLMAQRLACCLAIPADDCQDFVDAALRERSVFRLSDPSAPALGRPPGNLPAPVTSAVGRSAEIASIVNCLSTQRVRLLTLTGPVGVGKTLLALEAGWRTLREFRDGVFLIKLEPVQDPALAPAVTATVLGVREARQRDVAQSVVDSLAGKQILLIFDNFEHLLPAASFLSRLLADCRDVQVLATSRARLHLYGEHEFVVAPLDLPDLSDPARAAESSSVRLFCDRARAVRADFHLTPSLTPVVVDICRKLDGLPLAIELAAARVRLFSLQELQQRLDRRLPLLSQRTADLPTRLQGLETAISWSYGLLSPADRILLVRLAVFVNGFSVPAAEAVCDLADAGVPEGIESLLDQSLLSLHAVEPRASDPSRSFCAHCPSRLVREAAESVSRFLMLETIREFALDRLRDRGELATMRQRHAEYYATWAEQAEAHLHGPDQVIWLAQLERELDNLRAALTWLLSDGQVLWAARMACALGAFWQRHGHYSEGRRWLQQVLGHLHPNVAPIDVRGRVLQVAATLAYRQGDWQTAGEWLAESLASFRSTGDLLGVAKVLFDLGWIAIDRGEWSEGIRLNLESLAIARAQENPRAIYQALTNLGWAQLSGGEKEAAETLFDEALAHAREIGHTKGIAVSLANLSWIALYRNDLPQTTSLAQESLRLCCMLGEQEVLAECLDLLSVVAARSNDPWRAARLGGAGKALWKALHITRSPADHSSVARDYAAAAMRGHLPEDVLVDAWHQGETMGLDAAVALALGCSAAPRPREATRWWLKPTGVGYTRTAQTRREVEGR
jgi:non-specific serine/threonine protein kinase